MIITHSSSELCANRASALILTASEVCTSTDGLSKIANVALAIFTYSRHVGMAMSAACNHIGQALEGFSELTGIISLVKSCKDWFVPDESGKMMWQKAWNEISATVCSTASNILGFLIYLATTLKVFFLGMALMPLNIINSLMSIGSCAFDIWDNASVLKLSSQKTPKMIDKMESWKKLTQIREESDLPNNWISFVQKNKKMWTERITLYSSMSDKTKLAKAMSKKEGWEDLEKSSVENIRQYSSRQVVKFETQIKNQNISGGKAWMAIAVNALFIALSILSVVALFIAPGGLIVAMLLGSIVASTADLGLFVMNKHLK